VSKERKHLVEGFPSAGLIRGFTIIELLIVIAIIGVLGAYILSSVNDARDSAYVTRAETELENFHDSVQLYRSDHGSYPPDVGRGIPPGLENYLQSGNWPQGPWPESVYDWDHWTVDGEDIYQISIRFCDQGNPDTCEFPSQSWASDFGVNSAVYYCVEGPCRSHESEPIDYPGYCVNCEND
jgi:prepilin-type N-terminal cleavage/methylation domain-containing protein